MDIKNTLSNFQLENSRLIHFDIDNDFSELPANGTENSLSIGNPFHRVFKKDGVLFALLQLQINHTIEETKTERKLSMTLVIEGLFSFSGGTEEQFRQMLVLNGNSALYSIARAHILSITSMALISGRVVLPMINFLKVAEKLEKQ